MDYLLLGFKCFATNLKTQKKTYKQLVFLIKEYNLISDTFQPKQM